MRANSFDFSSSRNTLLDKVPFGCIDLSSTSSKGKPKSTNNNTSATKSSSSGLSLGSSPPPTTCPSASSMKKGIKQVEQQQQQEEDEVSSPAQSSPDNTIRSSGIIDASSFQEEGEEEDTTSSPQQQESNVKKEGLYKFPSFGAIPTTRQEKEEEGRSADDSPAPLEFLINHGDDLSDLIVLEEEEGSASSGSSSSLGGFTGSYNSHYDPTASISDILQQNSGKKRNTFSVSVTFKGLSSMSPSASSCDASNHKKKHSSEEECKTVTIAPREDIDTHFQETHLQQAKQQQCEQWAKKQELPREEFCSSERCQKIALLSFLRTAVSYHKSRVNTPDDEFRLFRLQLLLRRVVEERLRPNWSDPPRCWRIIQELNLFQNRVLDAVDDLLFELNY